MKENRRRFTRSEYQTRQAAVRDAMNARGIDILIVSDPSNMCWLTGYDGWSFYVHQCLVMDAGTNLFWFGRGIDARGAELTTDLPPQDIVSYPDHYVQSTERHPMQYLSDILGERGMGQARIGLEKDNYYFSARAAQSL